MPYKLIDGVFLVEGALNGAVMDTSTGMVYSVNDSACEILTGKVINEAYWQQLIALGLAEQSDEALQNQLPKLSNKEKLRFVWFEVVTNDCNERCEHCYAESMPRTYRKNLGLELPILLDQQPRQKLTHTDWLRIMRDAYELGCRRCQLIGGEPFLYKGTNGETLLDLAEYLVQLGYKFVEIYTNATLLTPDKIARIKQLGINVAISLYSSDPNVHDLVTRTPGSHAKTTQAIKLLKEAGVSVRVETVLMKINQQTIKETLELRQSLEVGGKGPDVLRPKGRGDNPLLQPDFAQLVQYGLMLKPNFTVTKEKLAHYSSGHSCLLGRITVTEFGEVLPCIFSRSNVVGNILVSDLRQIVLSSELRTIWTATKDNVMVCKDCEYRHVCFDCRPLSEGVAEGRADYLNAPYPRCTHNPYTGEWGQGLWRVDEQGNPYYDRQFAPQIQEVASTLTDFTAELSSH